MYDALCTIGTASANTVEIGRTNRPEQDLCDFSYISLYCSYSKPLLIIATLVADNGLDHAFK